MRWPGCNTVGAALSSASQCARAVVAELISWGVRDVVLAPGSRSAPLAYEVFEADRTGQLRLHVRIDERTGAFLALGLAKASGRVVPVITTSGTAAANLHPAVLEASHSHLPLMVITADRPRSMINTGANQTTQQDQLFGSHVRPQPRWPTRRATSGPGGSRCRGWWPRLRAYGAAIPDLCTSTCRSPNP